MAIQPDPDMVLCANLWRHGTTNRPPAVAYVSDIADPLGPQGTPRCRSCVSSLQSANHQVVRAHIDWINPDHDLNQQEPDDHNPDTHDIGGVPI
jgi:hypothetical protein